MSEDKKRIDINDTSSELSGVLGFLESFLRKYKGLAFLFAIMPLGICYLLSFAISFTPGYIIVSKTISLTGSQNYLVHAFLVGLSLGLSYLIYGFTLIFVVPIFNKLIPLRRRPWRGNWFSVQVIPWYFHNGLVQLVRYTFLDFVTPTPLNTYFYRAMGMKIGKNCIINTTNISDPCLIELEDNVTIGGSVTIFGHYGQSGILIFAPVLIKKGATIGLKASIMGDVVVGERAIVKAHEVLLPKTRVPNREKK